MLDIEKLKDEHKTIIGILSNFRRVLQRTTPPPPMELFSLRTLLTDTLVRHIKSEDWVLYPVLRRGGDRRAAEVAASVKNEGGDISEDYAHHCRKWSAISIARDWISYRRDSLSLFGRLCRRIDREEAEIFPLVEQQTEAA